MESRKPDADLRTSPASLLQRGPGFEFNPCEVQLASEVGPAWAGFSDTHVFRCHDDEVKETWRVEEKLPLFLEKQPIATCSHTVGIQNGGIRLPKRLSWSSLGGEGSRVKGHIERGKSSSEGPVQLPISALTAVSPRVFLSLPLSILAHLPGILPPYSLPTVLLKAKVLNPTALILNPLTPLLLSLDA